MKLAHEYKYGAQIDMPVYDASDLDKGQIVIWGQDASGTGTYNCLVDGAAVPVDVFGVLSEDPPAQATNFQTPNIDLALTQLVNIVPVWKVYWDAAAANDISATGGTSTTITHAGGDDGLDGCWVYLNSGIGAGQLRYCKGAAAGSKTVNTAWSTTPTSDTDFLLIRGQGRATGGQDLDSTFTLLKSAVSATGQLLILKNWVEGTPGTFELNVDDPDIPGLEVDGLNSRGVRFFSHIIFMDTFFSVDSIA